MAIIPLFIIVLLNEISYQMVIPAMGHVVELTSPHAGAALINTLYGSGIAIFTAAVIIGSPVIGYLSDKFGRKLILGLSLGLILFSSILFMFSLYTKNMTYFLMARGISGVAGASTAVVQAAIADISEHRARAVNFSLIGLALTIGLIIGPLLGGVFIHGHEINARSLMIPFWVTAIITGLNIVLFMLLVPAQKKLKIIQKTPVKMHSKKALNLLFLFFFLEFSWSLYYLNLPLFLGQVFNYAPQKISLFLSTTGISMCFGLAFYKWISRSVSNMTILKVFFSIFGSSLILAMVVKSEWLNWMIILPISWSVALIYVANMELISEKCDKSHQGILMGTLLTTMALAWTITGFCVKYLNSINIHTPFIVSIIGVLAGMIIVFCQPKASG
jgi:DHA1 family tetracycline resistance protein-like MFS transporter